MLSPAGDPALLRPDGARAADGTDDRNCQPVAEAIGHRGPHRLQHLLSRAVWDDQRVLDIAAAWAAGHLYDYRRGPETGVFTCAPRPCASCTGTAC